MPELKAAVAAKDWPAGASRSGPAPDAPAGAAHLRVSVATTEAMNTSLDQSSERVASQQSAQQVASQDRDLQIEQTQVAARSMNA